MTNGRNCEGEIDPKGDIWAAPYRWGCMVIAYKTNKFQKHKLAPIEDWADLWRPDLAGRISMVDSPREVVGAVLKYMGASYNTNDINAEVNGGRDAVKHNLALLAKQVRLFDSSISTTPGPKSGATPPSALIHRSPEFASGDLNEPHTHAMEMQIAIVLAPR
ncbi:uncharacterized protein LOC109796471 [Cajanus cajan]|uniref:uncharacterized protein LOC109796471 n=1 Tax=Cajanus cajan TaxID=3821 RepID=UPI00098DCAF1|nr:uncharacterized protein LOC109796471 [Cajanus cajan]